jgi:hypothetical protein
MARLPRGAGLVLLLSFAFSTLLACSPHTLGPSSSNTSAGASANAATDVASGLPCDVDRVLSQSCRTCHGATPSYGAPMSLMTAADLAAPAFSDPSKRVADLVLARTHDDHDPMPPAPNARLSAADQGALDRWIQAGRPASDAACSTNVDAGAPQAQPLSCAPDVHLAPAAAWTMNAPEQYVCYGVDVPTTSKRHAVVIAPRIDNARIVHHILVFQADASVDGHPTPCDAFGSSDRRMVYAWAPGGKALELPPQAGIPLEGTTHFVVQVHYNNAVGLASPTDQSGADFCTTDQLRPNDADVLAFGTESITIPPKGTLDETCTVSIPTLPELHTFAAFPHMHKLGTTIATTLHPAGGGAPLDLGQETAWDFNDQPWLPVDAVVRPGDSVATRCAWKNTTDATVKFGETTEDEMCFSFTMYYPRITTPGWHWALPSLLARCTATK